MGAYTVYKREFLLLLLGSLFRPWSTPKYGWSRNCTVVETLPWKKILNKEISPGTIPVTDEIPSKTLSYVNVRVGGLNFSGNCRYPFRLVTRLGIAPNPKHYEES